MVDSRKIRILTVDDQALLREGIAALVAGEPDMSVVGFAATGREAVVTGLNREDFTLLVNRKPVAITNFSAYATEATEAPLLAGPLTEQAALAASG
jgi:DNA-binding NarL/FixJ family response regulator